MAERVRKVGVIARYPAYEQLRMATGLISVHDDIVVVVVDHVLEQDAAAAEHIEAMKLMGVRLLTNMKENPFELIDDSQVSRVLAECDIVLS